MFEKIKPKLVRAYKTLVFILGAIIATVVYMSLLNFQGILVQDLTGKYLSITGYVFAFFVGISSMLFNWGRSLETDKYKDEIKVIYKNATRCITCSLCYLSAALIRFSLIQSVIPPVKPFLSFNSLTTKIIAETTITILLFYTVIVIANLIIDLFIVSKTIKRMTKSN